MNPAISLRVLRKTDLHAADQLRSLARWNQTVDDWQRLLHFAPQGCFGAFIETRLVGTVTTTIYDPRLAWIGMMLVHPDHRRKGIGTALMRQALDHLQSVRVVCIGLDATPAGLPLYASLGFVPEWTLTRWQRALRTKGSSEIAREQSRALSDQDWPAIETMDKSCISVPRTALLRSLASSALAAQACRVHRHFRGWGLLRPGVNADYLGPLHCHDVQAGENLTVSLLQAADERSVFWDIPDANESAKAAAENLGFTRLRPLTRMRLGTPLRPTPPPSLWAIADPALG